MGDRSNSGKVTIGLSNEVLHAVFEFGNLVFGGDAEHCVKACLLTGLDHMIRETLTVAYTQHAEKGGTIDDFPLSDHQLAAFAQFLDRFENPLVNYAASVLRNEE